MRIARAVAAARCCFRSRALNHDQVVGVRCNRAERSGSNLTMNQAHVAFSTTVRRMTPPNVWIRNHTNKFQGLDLSAHDFGYSECKGCGATLHSTNPNEPGFVSGDATVRTQTICQRCFTLKNHGLRKDMAHRKAPDMNSLTKALSLLRDIDKVSMVTVIDAFDPEGSMFDPRELAKAQSGIVIVNKCDLMPKQTHWGWYKNVCNQVVTRVIGHWVTSKNVFFVSALTGEGMKKLLEGLVEELESGKNLCFVGCANVGKSTLMNRVLTTLDVSKGSNKKSKKAKKNARRRHSKAMANAEFLSYVEPLDGVEDVQDAGVLLLRGDGQHVALQSKGEHDSQIGEAKRTPRVSGAMMEAHTELTESPLPGTTMGLLAHHIGEYLIYDSPGVVRPHSLVAHLDVDEFQVLIPKKQLAPVSLVLVPGQTLHLGGVAAVTNPDDAPHRVVLTVFCSSDVVFHRSKGDVADVRERLGETLRPQLGTLQRRKDGSVLRTLDFDDDGLCQTHIQIQGRGWAAACADICLGELGWIAVTTHFGVQNRDEGTDDTAVDAAGKDAETRKGEVMPHSKRPITLMVTASQHLQVKTREPLIPGDIALRKECHVSKHRRRFWRSPVTIGEQKAVDSEQAETTEVGSLSEGN